MARSGLNRKLWPHDDDADRSHSPWLTGSALPSLLRLVRQFLTVTTLKAAGPPSGAGR
jgi:hypothetical protein